MFHSNITITDEQHIARFDLVFDVTIRFRMKKLETMNVHLIIEKIN